MEIICKYVKEQASVDATSVKIKDITKSVDILMKRFIGAMCDDFPEINLDLQLCGSMAEETRTWTAISDRNEQLEFDYLAVMKTWPWCGELRFKHSETCIGYMNIEHDISDKDSVSGETDMLDNGIGDKFQINLFNSVDTRCKGNFCARYGRIGKQLSEVESTINLSKGCRFCTVYASTGNLRMALSKQHPHDKVWLVWNAKLCSEEMSPVFGNHINIRVDLHPIFKMDPKQIIHTSTDPEYANLLTETGGSWYLFPKKCKEQHTNWKCVHTTWRISTYETELNLIRKMSSEHRLAYRILKFIIALLASKHSLGMKEFRGVTSYELKNILLHHTCTCDDPTLGVEICLLEMLKRLSKCYAAGSLPHFLLNYNTLDRLPHKNSYRIMEYFLQTINDILNITNAHSTFDDVLKDFISIKIILDWELTESKNHRNNEMVSIPSTLTDFVRKRHTKSADDTINDILVLAATHKNFIPTHITGINQFHTLNHEQINSSVQCISQIILT